MSPDFAAARRAMIDSQLRPEGVTDGGVLSAMGRVPREQFVPETQQSLAYSDRPVTLGDGGSLMPPAALGRLLNELRPRRGEQALVIGNAGDYAAAILRQIGLDVHVAENADAAGADAYDLILIDGAVGEVPAKLSGLLKPSGRIAAAIIDRGVTRLSVGQSAGGTIGMRSFLDAQVPILPGAAKAPAFTF